MRSMKKLTSVFLVLCLSLLMILPATAATETPQMKEKRILNEVLTGEITNQDDIIQYALAQRETRTRAAAQAYTAEEGDSDISDDFTITQVLGESVDENGCKITNIATSSLIVTNEAGEQITAIEYNYYNESHASTAGSSQCSVTAVLTMYVQVRIPVSFNQSAVKVLSSKTTVYNNGTSGANSLQQTYYADRASVNGVNPYTHQSSIIYSPTNATAYTYTPYDPSPWYPTGQRSAVLRCNAIVKVGSVTLKASCVYSLDEHFGWSWITD